MVPRPSMSPAEYVELVGELVAAGLNDAALDVYREVGRDLLPQLSGDQLAEVSGYFEAVAMIESLAAAEGHTAA